MRIYYRCLVIFVILFLIIQFAVSQTIPTSLTEAGIHPQLNIKSSHVTEKIIGGWSQGADMILSPRYYGGSVVYSRNDTTWLYVIGGDTTGSGIPTATCLRYNYNTNSWDKIAPLPGPQRVNTAVLVGDKIYSLGGFDAPFPAMAIKKFYVYDILTNTWSQLPDLPARLFFAGAVGYQDSLIYIIGGVEQTTNPDNIRTDIWTLKVRVFDLDDESFSEADSMIQPTGNFGLGLRGNFLSVVGGVLDPNTVSNSTQIGQINTMNPWSINWSQENNYPLSIHAQYGYRFGDRIFFNGGSNTTGFTPLSNVYSLEFSNYTYNMETNLPIPNMAFYAGTSVIHGRMQDYQRTIFSGGITTGPTISMQTYVREDTITVSGIVNPNNMLPAEIELHQNYPNPFNPNTTIAYTLPEAGHVKIKIYDVQGREVMNLVNEYKNTGQHVVNFISTNLSSGVYYYTLVAGNFTRTRKMLLIR